MALTIEDVHGRYSHDIAVAVEEAVSLNANMTVEEALEKFVPTNRGEIANLRTE
ncbi:hypothetical protein KW783_04125 [Candidatus Parcubacteria bacterium]|nr:hypothetical protein [Candidatus Parcubacteria bacterium]